MWLELEKNLTDYSRQLQALKADILHMRIPIY